MAIKDYSKLEKDAKAGYVLHDDLSEFEDDFVDFTPAEEDEFKTKYPNLMQRFEEWRTISPIENTCEYRYLMKDEYEFLQNHFKTLSEENEKKFKNDFQKIAFRYDHACGSEEFIQLLVDSLNRESKTKRYSVSTHELEGRNFYCMLIDGNQDYPFYFYTEYLAKEYYDGSHPVDTFDLIGFYEKFLCPERLYKEYNEKAQKFWLSNDEMNYVYMTFLDADEELKAEFHDRFYFLDLDAINLNAYKIFADQIVFELKRRSKVDTFFYQLDVQDEGQLGYSFYWGDKNDRKYAPMRFGYNYYGNYKDLLRERKSFNRIVTDMLTVYRDHN